VPVAYIDGMPKSSRRKNKARVLSSREVYRGPVFWITTEQVIEPSGVHATRDIVRHPGSVVILAVEESQAQPRILLERQYRHTAQDLLWELPAGSMDPGENPLAAAKRELLEETGYTATRWKLILNFYASPGFLAETMRIYLARGLRPGKAQPEADEVIDLHLVPLPKAVRMVMRGTIRDAKTISGVLWLAQNGTSRKPRR
jgi:ADP-ribose pyrophosphatase